MNFIILQTQRSSDAGNSGGETPANSPQSSTNDGDIKPGGQLPDSPQSSLSTEK